MTDDLVTRLRENYEGWGSPPNGDGVGEERMAWNCNVAADELERLRAGLQSIADGIYTETGAQNWAKFVLSRNV
jgi:hypothetical protein